RSSSSIRGYIEELERRVVLSPVIAPMSVMHAQTATLNGTTLKIIGDNTDDTINLAFVANGAGTEDDQVTVTLNGTDTGTFTLANIKLITINSFGGDDTITADAEITTASQIVTGEGNDDVTSSDGNDLIKAGKGFDTVDGGNGDNTIIGARGD